MEFFQNKFKLSIDLIHPYFAIKKFLKLYV